MKKLHIVGSIASIISLSVAIYASSNQTIEQKNDDCIISSNVGYSQDIEKELKCTSNGDSKVESTVEDSSNVKIKIN